LDRQVFHVTASLLTKDSRMAERISSRLRINAETMRLSFHRDPREEMTVSRIDRVNLGIVPAGQPEHPSVRGNAAHIGACPLAQAPFGDFLPAAEIDHGDATFPTVGDVKHA